MTMFPSLRRIRSAPVAVHRLHSLLACERRLIGQSKGGPRALHLPRPRFEAGSVMKRRLSPEEKAAVVEGQRALILASRPCATVSIWVEDETDDNGGPISQIMIQEKRDRYRSRFEAGSVMKRRLSPEEKAAVVERQRALILASRPCATVSIQVEDETDDNGGPISQIMIQEKRDR
jgi:hypothetical protein